MVHKPERWAVNQAEVAREWQWAWRGLLLSLSPGNDADTFSFDPVSRLVWTNVGSLTQNIITKFGPGWYSPTTALLGATNIQPDIANFTLVLVGRFTDIAAVQGLLIKRTGGVASRSFYSLIDASGVLHVGTDVPSSSSASTSLWSEGESIIVITSSADGVRFFQDGKLIDSSGTPLSGSSSTAGFVFGQRATDATNDRFNGDIVLCALFGRALLDDEVRVLSADPFGPIRPRRLTPADVSTPTNPIVIDHDFNSSNGAPWPPPWVDDSVSGGTVDIQSGVGRLTDGGTDQEARTYSSEISDSVEMTFRIRAYGTGDYRCDAGFMVGTTWQSAGEDPQNGYYLWCTDGAAPALYRVVGGSYQLLDGTVGADFGTNWYWFRMRYDSTDGRLQVRQWLDGTAEPGDWDADVTDSNHQGSTFRAFFTHYAPANDGIYVDNITVTDLTANTYRSDSFRTKVFVP